MHFLFKFISLSLICFSHDCKILTVGLGNTKILLSMFLTVTQQLTCVSADSIQTLPNKYTTPTKDHVKLVYISRCTKSFSRVLKKLFQKSYITSWPNVQASNLSITDPSRCTSTYYKDFGKREGFRNIEVLLLIDKNVNHIYQDVNIDLHRHPTNKIAEPGHLIH